MANGFVHIPFNPANDPLTHIGQGAARAIGGIGQGFAQARERQQQQSDVIALKQWVDGGMEGPPPTTQTEFGGNLVGNVVMEQARESLADPGGRTLRQERRKLRSETKLRRAQTAEAQARADVISSTGSIGSTAGFTAGERGLFAGSIQGRIDSVKTKLTPGFKGRKQARFIEEWDALRKDPTIGWDNLPRTKQIQIWQMYNSALVGQSQKDNEIQWDPTSKEVQGLVKEMFGTKSLPTPTPTSQDTAPTQTTTFVPVGATDSEIADFRAGLIPEDQERFAAIERLWNEARNSGDIGAQDHWESVMSRAIDEARTRKGPDIVDPLPQVFPNNTAGVTLRQRSTATKKPTKRRVILGGIHR